jgi:hypothetical protein
MYNSFPFKCLTDRQWSENKSFYRIGFINLSTTSSFMKEKNLTSIAVYVA